MKALGVVCFIAALLIFPASLVCAGQQEPRVEVGKGDLFAVPSNYDKWKKYADSIKIDVSLLRGGVLDEVDIDDETLFFIENKPATNADFREFVRDSAVVVLSVRAMRVSGGLRFRLFSHIIEAKLSENTLARIEMATNQVDWVKRDKCRLLFAVRSSVINTLLANGGTKVGELAVVPISTVAK